jgi:hypothetical protein
MVGPLAHLKNHVYIGEVADRGEVHKASTRRSLSWSCSTLFRQNSPSAPCGEKCAARGRLPCSWG